jgi:hypothetical protein
MLLVAASQDSERSHLLNGGLQLLLLLRVCLLLTPVDLYHSLELPRLWTIAKKARILIERPYG